jgi:transposase-like protein
MARGYISAPRIPAELSERYQVITEVISGALTVSEAARRLGLSRNRFQTLLHRALAGLMEGMAAHPAGRSAPPETERRLQQELDALRKENRRLRERVETTDRVLGVASGMLKGRLGRQRTSRDRGDTEDE